MIKMRVILAVLATVIVGAQVPLLGHLVGWWAYGVHGGSVVLFVAAVSIVVLSFFRVDQTPSGELCFDRDNPLWKLVCLMWGTEKKPILAISLCRCYWTMVLFIVFNAMLLGVIAFVIGFAIPEVARAAWAALQNDFRGVIKSLLAGFGLCAVIAGTVAALVYLAEKVAWFRKVAQVALACAYGLLVLFVFVVVPVTDIAKKRNVEVAAAAGVWLKYAALTVGLIGVAVLGIWAAFRYFPVLKNTWLGRILGHFKKNFCPTLTACSGSYAG